MDKHNQLLTVNEIAEDFGSVKVHINQAYSYYSKSLFDSSETDGYYN